MRDAKHNSAQRWDSASEEGGTNPQMLLQDVRRGSNTVALPHTGVSLADSRSKALW